MTLTVALLNTAIGLAVFAASYAYDFAYTRFQVAVNNRESTKAGRWSVATYLIGLVGMAGVLKYSYWLIIPEVLGMYFGTKRAVSTADPIPVMYVVQSGDESVRMKRSDEVVVDPASPVVN